MHWLPEYPNKIAISGFFSFVAFCLVAASLSSNTLWLSNSVKGMNGFIPLFSAQIVANPRWLCIGVPAFSTNSIGPLIDAQLCNPLSSALPGTGDGSFSVNLGGGAVIQDAVMGAKDMQRGGYATVVLLGLSLASSLVFMALATALFMKGGELEGPLLLNAFKAGAAFQFFWPFMAMWVYLGATNAAKAAWTYTLNGSQNSLIDLNGLTTGFYLVVSACVILVVSVFFAVVVWPDEVVIGPLAVAGAGAASLPMTSSSSIPGVPTSPFYRSNPRKKYQPGKEPSQQQQLAQQQKPEGEAADDAAGGHEDDEESGTGTVARKLELNLSATAASSSPAPAGAAGKKTVSFSAGVSSSSPSSSSSVSASPTNAGAGGRGSQTSDALRSSLAVYAGRKPAVVVKAGGKPKALV